MRERESCKGRKGARKGDVERGREGRRGRDKEGGMGRGYRDWEEQERRDGIKVRRRVAAGNKG